MNAPSADINHSNREGGCDQRFLHPSAGDRRVQPFAPELGRQSHQTRHVLVSALAGPGAYVRGIARFARTCNWRLDLEAWPSSGGWAAHHDGILVVPHNRELAAVPPSALFPPCIALSENADEENPQQVGFDHREIGRVAAVHLLERFHRHFAWAPQRPDPANAQRLIGFREELTRRGNDCTLLPPVYGHDDADGLEHRAQFHQVLIAELKRLPRPLAVFAYNDHVALEVIAACQDAGLAIPDDVSVLGVGDTLACSASPIPLSTVELDYEKSGYQAASLLEQMMADLRPMAPVRVGPIGVATRRSTDALAVADQRVARALQFIAANFSNPTLSVDSVANISGMSRRQLERAVKRETGSTINDHIVRIRMNEASRFLQDKPRAKSDEIAARVGFIGRGTFFRTFRRYYGTSPKRISAGLPKLGRLGGQPIG